MKYIVIIPDGMADYPNEEHGGMTPLAFAGTPNTDRLARLGTVGTVSTVPAEMVPESDTANLAILGYDPRVYSKGRSPLEAMSMGISLAPNQTAVRANLVALSEGGDYEDKLMLDHSSDEITTDEARVLIECLQKELCLEGMRLYTGVSYRHCLVYDDAPDFRAFTRPHDIIGRRIGDYLPDCKPYLTAMKQSYEILNNHPLNLDRAKRGLKKANSLWFWSPGKKPALPSFSAKTGLEGSVICAVDLIKGIGKCAGLDTPYVPGATGGCVTDYSAKAEAALAELERGKDFVYVHIEAPDECGHKGSFEMKTEAIHNIDRYIVGHIADTLEKSKTDFRMMVLPDHPTPVSVRTHTHEDVPFLIYDSRYPKASGIGAFTEEQAKSTGIHVGEGFTLMDRFLKGEL